MTNDKKGMSREEFLKAIGGIGLAAVALKVGGLTSIASAIKPKKAVVATVPGSYGNNSYGGKHA